MKLLAALVVAIALAAALSAQVPPGQQKPVFRAGANFVRVDVYATTQQDLPFPLDLRGVTGA